MVVAPAAGVALSLPSVMAAVVRSAYWPPSAAAPVV